MKEVWYKTHHEMSKITKSTQTFSGLPMQSSLSSKSYSQETAFILRFAELHYSPLGVPESELLDLAIETIKYLAWINCLCLTICLTASLHMRPVISKKKFYLLSGKLQN